MADFLLDADYTFTGVSFTWLLIGLGALALCLPGLRLMCFWSIRSQGTHERCGVRCALLALCRVLFAGTLGSEACAGELTAHHAYLDFR